MKVKAKQIVEVEIDKEELYKALKNKIILDLDNCYLNDDKTVVLYDVKYHNWETEKLRNATATDIKIFQTLHNLKELLDV